MKRFAKFVVIGVLGFVAFLVLLGGVLALLGVESSSTDTDATSEPTEQDCTEAESGIPGVLGMLGTFEQQVGNIRRSYVLIEPSLTDDQVIDIAQALRDEDPEPWYYLMDSDDEFDVMFEALPATEQGDLSTWPVEYVEDHFVARTAQEIRSVDGDVERVWQVEGGAPRPDLLVDIR